MQKNTTFPFLLFFISMVIYSSFKSKADEYFSFSNAYNKALSNSNIIKKNEFLLNSKTNLISNSYSSKDWSFDFTSSFTLDNKKLDNIGDYIDQKTTVNTISLDKNLIDFGYTDISVEIALNDKKIALNNLLLAKQDLFINTLTSYLNVYNSNKILNLRISNVKRFNTAVKASKLKLSAGTITPTTVSEAEAKLARSEYDLAISKTEQLNYINEFKSLIGEDFDLKKLKFPEFKYSLPKSIKEAEKLSLKSNLKIANICKKYDVPVPAAAIQFCYTNKLVTSMILGMDRLDQVEQNLEFLNFPIPEDLWKDLLNEKLIDERCPI